MVRPAEWGGWWGVHGDWRKPFRLELDTGWAIDAEGGDFYEVELEAEWDVSARLSKGLSFDSAQLPTTRHLLSKFCTALVTGLLYRKIMGPHASPWPRDGAEG